MFEWEEHEGNEVHKLSVKVSDKVLTQLEDVGQQLALTFNSEGSELAVGGEVDHLFCFSICWNKSVAWFITQTRGEEKNYGSCFMLKSSCTFSCKHKEHMLFVFSHDESLYAARMSLWFNLDFKDIWWWNINLILFWHRAGEKRTEKTKILEGTEMYNNFMTFIQYPLVI